MRKENINKLDQVMTIILSTLLIIALTMVFTSCGSVRVGGCGGSPVHLGN